LGRCLTRATLASMAGAAITRLDPDLLSVEGVQRWLDRLPAETRARVAWLPNQLTTAVASFLDGPRDEPSLSVLVTELRRLAASIEPAVVSMAEQPDLLRSELEADWRSDAALLRATLDPGAPDAADAAEWTMRSYIALSDLSRSLIGAASEEIKGVIAAAGGSSSAAEGAAEGVTRRGSSLRVRALIMAALEGAHRQVPQSVVADLVLRAFDEMALVLRSMHALGLRIDPFKGETLAERAQRTRRYAAHIRSVLTPDDMQALEASRLRQLR
jgi:hypothetical protein